jgi:hypothetical protein
MAKWIEITADGNGDFKVEAFGFEGKDCLAATKAAEDIIGGEVVSGLEKPEMAKIDAKSKSVLRQGNARG